jgi:hypothetical protein
MGNNENAMLFGKEISIDIDEKCWWVGDMISSFHLTIGDVLLLRHDRKAGIKSLVEREFGSECVNKINFVGC